MARRQAERFFFLFLFCRCTFFPSSRGQNTKNKKKIQIIAQNRRISSLKKKTPVASATPHHPPPHYLRHATLREIRPSPYHHHLARQFLDLLTSCPSLSLPSSSSSSRPMIRPVMVALLLFRLLPFPTTFPFLALPLTIRRSSTISMSGTSSLGFRRLWNEAWWPHPSQAKEDAACSGLSMNRRQGQPGDNIDACDHDDVVSPCRRVEKEST